MPSGAYLWFTMTETKNNGAPAMAPTNGKSTNSKTSLGKQLSERINRWVNALTAQGTVQDSRTAGFFSTDIVPIEDSVLESLYANNDFAKTIVDRIVEDALRNEPQFVVLQTGETPEDAIQMGENIVGSDLVQSWDVISKTAKAAIWGRLYGCGGILLGVNDGKDPREPLELPIRPGQLEWIEVVDKLNLTQGEIYNSSADVPDGDKSKVGTPKTYNILPSTAWGWGERSMTVHESRIIMFGGARTSNRVKAYNDYCDLSVLQDKFDLLRDIGATEHAIHQMIQGASQAVYKVKGLMDQISQDENRILELMRIVDYSRNTGRAIILDADGEEFAQVGAENISGISELQNNIYQRLAAAARMPLTVLMGQSPAGLNATGESDSRHWYNQVESYQKDVLAHRMTRLMTVILQSEGLLTSEQEVSVHFPSLWEMDEAEKASLMKTKAEVARTLIDAGIATPQELRDWFL